MSLYTDTLHLLHYYYNQKTKIFSDNLALILNRLGNKKSRLFETSMEVQTLLQDATFLTDEEVRVLNKYAIKPKVHNIVEIGTAYGSSTLVIISSLTTGNKHLYSIDPFINDSKGGFKASPSRTKRSIRLALRSLKLDNRINYWTLIKKYSYDVAKSWDLPVGMIFIDGDHNYRGVKRDFRDWFPLVQKGGYFLFHDSRMLKNPKLKDSRGYPGPTKLMAELKRNKAVKLIDTAFSISVWQKQ